MVAVGYTFLIILASVGLIYSVYLRSERQRMNHKLRAFIKPTFRPWKVDKQMIIKEPEKVNSTEIVMYDPMAFKMMDLSLPRFIRVSITNGSQIKLIGDCPTTDEDEAVRLMAEAESECEFLNAHDVK